MGRDGGRKLAPNLFLIPYCHEIETFTHLSIFVKSKSNNRMGKEP